MSVFVPPRVSCVARHQNNKTDEELEKMRSKAEALFTRAGDIKVEVENAELNGCERKTEVENWLQKVENVKDQVRGGASSSRTVPVAEITKEIDELLQHSLPRELTFSNVPFVTGSLKGHLFEENWKRILSLLDDDEVATIGIHGAGGIGKTTLVAHVQKGLCEKFNNDRCSGNVYFATVSHGLTVSGLQSKIANQLGLMIEGANVMKAAAMIHRAFMKRNNSILILDDLWESFRPSDVGLPVGKGGFKLLLTTRNKRVCHEINNEKSQIIEVKCLSDDESWDLFREKLGDSAILAQAGDIARKVAKKCRGLPLALEHIAISMRAANTVEDWRTVLDDMSSMMLDVMEDKVLPLLRYSYDRLRDQQLKDCFLYCSLFPEDHVFYRPELVDNWIIEGPLDGMENRERQRDKGFTIFKELINLSLLKADGNDYWSAKMHDLVREMGVKVGKEKNIWDRYICPRFSHLRHRFYSSEWKGLICRIRNVKEFNEYIMSQCFASLHQYDLTVGQGGSYVGFFGRFRRVLRAVKFVESYEEDSPIIPGNVEGLGLEMCSGVEYLVSSASPDSTLGDLVWLYLERLKNFKGLVKPGVALPPGSLSNLKRIWIYECHGIKKLFTSSMVRGSLQNLEYLGISFCRHLEEVIGGSDSENDDDDDGDEYRDFFGDRVVERLSIFFPSTAFTPYLKYISEVEIKDERLSIYFPCSPRLHTLHLGFGLPHLKRVVRGRQNGRENRDTEKCAHRDVILNLLPLSIAFYIYLSMFVLYSIT